VDTSALGHGHEEVFQTVLTAARWRGTDQPSRSRGASMIRVLIVDDTRLYREALAGMLRSESLIGAVDTASDSATALDHLVMSSPQVVLVNTAMADSAMIFRMIADVAAQVPVVALGVSESEAEVITWAEAGVAGYLFKTESLANLVATIQGAARGEALCPPRITAALLRRVAALAAERQPEIGAARLTAREKQIIELVDEGLSNKEIARRLSIEVRTVKNHVHNILEKLQVSRRGEAAARVREARVTSRS
jgi:two-component system nitrate/nitrite response regulator NarL